MSLTFITGGIRSGKSVFAEELASAESNSVLYVAFGVKTDKEMEQRIHLHQRRRPNSWGVLEEPNELLKTMSNDKNYDVILIECLSTWLSNRCVNISIEKLSCKSTRDSIIHEVQQWMNKIEDYQKQVIIVSSEVGFGGVAMSPLGRAFQDLLGEINQLVAKKADKVYAVFSGIPMRLKS